ncbi:hypothetical protein LPJ53_001730 [Coemansia erecta]|uniref:MFS general substrate transporter n=1 Tax=Coemansia erecta TaxID=147472 RepID=A0A9W7XZH9_9FUNG|nr:hypothetical protein LPJ53_001730 [Coemansia erecta]
MRYNSPSTQLALVGITVFLIEGVRRLLYNYLALWSPKNDNVGFNSYLPDGIVAVVSGIVCIFLINLTGFRYIYVFFGLTNVLYACSMVVMFHNGWTAFQDASLIIGIVGNYASRVATLVIVLAYPSEKWKARALAIFLLIEYLSNALGDIITFHGFESSTKTERYHVSIVYLAISCLGPFVALLVAPSHEVIRDNGVYILSPETNLKTEFIETAKIFTSKKMLLMIPYMFSYPMLFGIANMKLPDKLFIAMYDVGKILVLFMGQLLDLPWSNRRTRGTLGLLILALFFFVSLGLTTSARYHHYDMTGFDKTWPEDKVNNFMFQAVVKEQYKMVAILLFFAGIASGFIEIFGYWLMGTLTNDVKASARFVGTFHSFMALGGIVGFQTIQYHDSAYNPRVAPYYVATGLTILSFVLIFFVVREIPDSNDWSLERIAHKEELVDLESAEAIATISDVKYSR